MKWVSVANDGTDPASGPVSAYDVRYVAMGAGANCSALTFADYATATPFPVQPTPNPMVGVQQNYLLSPAAAVIVLGATRARAETPRRGAAEAS